MEVKLISWTKDPIGTCAKAASMCYDSEPSRKIVRGCIKSGHSSIIEHANYTFKITGVSRSLLAQLTRHRHASYSVESQRYVPMGTEDYYAMPVGNGKKANGYCHYDVNQEVFICEQYERGLSCNEISEMYGIPPTTINGILKRNERKVRVGSETKFINSDYFKDIDSADKAFILGFIYSDGCIGTKENGNKNLIIDQLNNEDVMLRYIGKELKTHCKIIKSGHDDTSRICIQSNELCDSLIEYGITPRKAHTINPSIIFEKLPKEYIRDFIRGVFEGDGNIHIDKEQDTIVQFSIAGTYDTCEQIQNYLMSELGLSKTTLTFNVGTTYVLHYGGGQQVRKIIEHLYKDLESSPLLHHSRKMNKVSKLCPEIFEEWKSRFINTVESETKHIFPDPIKKSSDSLFTTAMCFYRAIDAYDEIKKEEAMCQMFGEKANENARAVLLNACSTNLVMTMNLRAMMNFMNERLCTRAQLEIRKMANKMKEAVLSCPDHTDEDKEIVKSILVPKCERYEIPFCPEYQCCGRHKKLIDIVK